DVEAAGEDRREFLEQPAHGVGPTGRQGPRDRTLVAARQDVQTLRVRGDLFESHARLALRFPERPRGDQPAEILVAGAVLDEESETRKGCGRGDPRFP